MEYKETNNSVHSIIANALQASLGLFLFGFGVYLTIQANIGVSPWDVLNIGLSTTFGIKYGTAAIFVSLLVFGIDLVLREKIGIGLILDSFIVGKTVDLFNLIGIIQLQQSLVTSLVLIISGLIILGFSQFLYMRASLGCGPRDTLLVGLSRKMPKIPIGVISICILGTVTYIGWLFGGPVGLGTVICVGLEGLIMQTEFRLIGFVPTNVKHQNIAQSIKILRS